MTKTLFIPKIQISLLLFLLFIIVAPRIGIVLALYLLTACLFFTVGSDLLFAFIRRKTIFKEPYAAIVTGLILTLIIDTSTVWYQMLLICLSAMVIKNFLRIGGRHVLNPAASGLLVGYILFGLNPSWWGPTFYLGGLTNPLNIAIFVVVLAFGLVSVRRMKRVGVVASFMFSSLVFAFLNSFKFSISLLTSVFLSPGVWFYSLVMLPEPMTSPVNMGRQVMYGVFVALVTFLLVQFVLPLEFLAGNFPDVTLVALLLGNIVFFKFR